MSSEDSGCGSDSIATKMVALNSICKDKSFEEEMEDCYDIFISDDGTELFACKLNGCPTVEKQECDIIEHLKQHFLGMSHVFYILFVVQMSLSFSP